VSASSHLSHQLANVHENVDTVKEITTDANDIRELTSGSKQMDLYVPFPIFKKDIASICISKPQPEMDLLVTKVEPDHHISNYLSGGDILLGIESNAFLGMSKNDVVEVIFNLTPMEPGAVKFQIRCPMYDKISLYNIFL